MSEEDFLELNFLAYGTKVGHYSVDHLIGEGGFGQIYNVIDVNDNKHHYAMKIEYLDARKIGLKLESQILKNLQNSQYFPSFECYGSTDTYRYLIMELFGPSLATVRRAIKNQIFSKYSLLNLGYHMVCCIEELHKLGYIHRDIKPGNFLIRPLRSSPLVLIDFGLSRSYINRDTGLHREPRKVPGYAGTVRYASLNAHDCHELSRRDDLISWFYSMIEMSESQTPWPGNGNKRLARKMKQSLTKDQLCEHFPPEFKQIYDAIFNLAYDETPDYAKIKNLIQTSIINSKFETRRYEWESFSKCQIMSISPISLDMGEPSDISKKIKERDVIIEGKKSRSDDGKKNVNAKKNTKELKNKNTNMENNNRKGNNYIERDEEGCTACIIC